MKKLALLASVLALGACQTAGPSYEAASTPGGTGYFSTPVEDGRHAVTYTGERKMTPAQVAEYALLRAAELTLASGHEWFAVLHTENQQVQVGDMNTIAGRSGSVLTGESTTAGSGGDRRGAGAGVDDAEVPGGPTTGGFGGGDVPYQVLERWTPRSVPRTNLIIQMGSGNRASFDGLETAPEILSAQAVVDEIRAKMAQ